MFLLQFNYTHVLNYVGIFALYNFSLSFFDVVANTTKRTYLRVLF